MSKCPECGRAGPPSTPANAEAEVILRIPERHFALFRKLFRDMETKLGMHGLGELANEVRPYGAPFRNDMDRWRYFDDAAVALCMIGIARGFPASVRIGPAVGLSRGDGRRHEVSVDFRFPDGGIRPLRVAEGAPHAEAEWFRDHITDLQARLCPEPQPSLRDAQSGPGAEPS